MLFAVLLGIKLQILSVDYYNLAFKLLLHALEEYVNLTGCHVAIISTSFPLPSCFYSKDSHFSFTGREKKIPQVVLLIKVSLFPIQKKMTKKKKK